ncbi:MAG: SPW repeat protein, partial [Salinimicrobium sp.]
GMSVPWTLEVSTVLGIAMMFAPAFFGVDISTTAADIFYLSGSLIVVTSVICMGEIVRRGRYFNILLGLILAVGPWFVAGSTTGLSITGLVAGALVILLAFPLGPVKEEYGLWNKYVS